MWTLSDIGVSGKTKIALPVMAVIFNLSLTQTSESVHIIPAVLLDPENVGVAQGVSTSCLLHGVAFEVSLPSCAS